MPAISRRPAKISVHPPPTAVFCYNDMTAMRAVRCLHDHGMRIPRDISVIGFDDLPISPFFQPPLTTIRQPKAEMGRDAAATLLKMMRGETADVPTSVPGTLVVRSSTAPPRKAEPNG